GSAMQFVHASDGTLMPTPKLPEGLNLTTPLVFAPDGQTFAAGSWDGLGNDFKVQLWHVADSKLVRTLVEPTSLVKSIAFAPDGQILASAEYSGTVRWWRVTD